MDGSLTDSNVKRIRDRIILVKFVVWENAINVSAYAPQVESHENTKKKFLQYMNILIQGVPSEKFMLEGEQYYHSVHEGYGYGVRN